MQVSLNRRFTKGMSFQAAFGAISGARDPRLIQFGLKPQF